MVKMGKEVDFGSLWLNTIQPKVLASLKRKGVNEDDAEDIAGETMIRLWERVGDSGIQELEVNALTALAIRAADNLRIDAIRRENPIRNELRKKVLLILKEGSMFCLWQMEKENLCGLAHWENKRKSFLPRSLKFFEGDYGEFQQEVSALEVPYFHKDDIKSANRLARLIKYTFEWVGAPVAVRELVGILYDLLGLQDIHITSKDAPREDEDGNTLEVDIASEEDISISVLNKEQLLAFGQFIHEYNLDRCQRSSTLFTLQPAFIIGNLGLTMTELARLNEDTIETFVSQVWSNLPIKDLQIAEYLGYSVLDQKAAQQKVSNCRMITLTRAWPRWAREHDWLD